MRIRSARRLRYRSTLFREKGDPSKARDFLPADKQYLVTRGVPCLRRATSLAYTDADEDAERYVSFGDGGDAATTSAKGKAGDGDEWVETHANRKPTNNNANHAALDEIPDVDDDDDDGLSRGVGGMSLGGAGSGSAAAAQETPDLDDIPDMEEDELEEIDEATAKPSTAKPIAVAAAEYVLTLSNDHEADIEPGSLQKPTPTFFKSEPTTL